MKSLIFSFTCLLLAITCQARIITVDNDGPADFNNIQAAINDANNGDTINVAEGVYYENIRIEDKNDLTLKGAGPDLTTIDGGGKKDVVTFRFASGTISGFKITNSGKKRKYYGSGVGASYSTVTIENNIIEDNYKAIAVYNVSNGVIIGNKIINNCGFWSTLDVMESGVTICNNLIAHNLWEGIRCELSSPLIINNTIANNGSDGIVLNIPWYHDPNSIQVIYNNIITQNENGIVVYGQEWLSQAIDALIASLLWVCYNNVWNNAEYNYIYESPGCVSIDGTPCWPPPTSKMFTPKPGWGEISRDPLFADPTNNDYHLKSQEGRWDPGNRTWVQDDVHSPCIDAGNTASDWTGELWPHGKRINMGAYGGTQEASMSLSALGNVANLDNDVKDMVDFADLALFVDKWCKEEILLAEDLNRDGVVDSVDYAIFAQHWLDVLVP